MPNSQFKSLTYSVVLSSVASGNGLAKSLTCLRFPFCAKLPRTHCDFPASLLGCSRIQKRQLSAHRGCHGCMRFNQWLFPGGYVALQLSVMKNSLTHHLAGQSLRLVLTTRGAYIGVHLLFICMGFKNYPVTISNAPFVFRTNAFGPAQDRRNPQLLEGDS
ncbi:hypothetical protein BJ165DRAFT_1180645 [Panaeolus papilionaceus]|nr:hypothetical protein BJ165DRAFT_1180645 [Panaeolus papilionaceus]